MPLILDHLFICCRPDGPEAQQLHARGFTEGTPNVHTGQGTANRRFFFRNFYVELLWVHDEAEARGPRSAQTRLWERWSGRGEGGLGETCPFGLVFRPAGDDTGMPFATRSYLPAYLPPGWTIELAAGTSLAEPEIACLPCLRQPGTPSGEPVDHPNGAGDVTGVTVTLPDPAGLSSAGRAIEAQGLVRFRQGPAYLLEIRYAAQAPQTHDFQPVLPLVFRGEPVR